VNRDVNEEGKELIKWTPLGRGGKSYGSKGEKKGALSSGGRLRSAILGGVLWA